RSPAKQCVSYHDPRVRIRSMSKLILRADVPRGIDIRVRGSQSMIDRDCAPLVDSDPGLIEPEALDVAAAPRCDQHAIDDGPAAAADRQLDALRCDAYRLHLAAHVQYHSLSRERLRDEHSGLRLFHRQHLGRDLEELDASPEPRERLSQLAAGSTRAENREPLRLHTQLEHRFVRERYRRLEPCDRWQHGARAGGDHGFSGMQRRLADPNQVRIFERRLSEIDIHARVSETLDGVMPRDARAD